MAKDIAETVPLSAGSHDWTVGLGDQEQADHGLDADLPARDGDIPTVVLADRGRAAVEAVRRAAARLQRRLDGVVVTPAARTPLQASIAGSAF